jgi:Tol biopolymer transport system component
MNVDGSEQKQLTDNPAGSSGDSCFSPDGSKIAFVSDRDGDLEIYIMNVDGSDQMQLTYNESNDTIGSFSN